MATKGYSRVLKATGSGLENPFRFRRRLWNACYSRKLCMASVSHARFYWHSPSAPEMWHVGSKDSPFASAGSRVEWRLRLSI